MGPPDSWSNPCSPIASDVTRMFRDDELAYTELESIEKSRREILQFSELPFYKVLTKWNGTCLRILLFDPLVWFTVAIYILLRIKCRFGLPDYLADADLSSDNISVLGGFLSFFLVFFVVNSNTEFNSQYNQCMAAKGRILDIASMARAFLPREIGLRLVRRLNAAHVVAYVGLSEVYTATNFFPETNDTYKLLTDEEYERVKVLNMNDGGSAYREIVTWCQLEVASLLKQGIIDARLASTMRDKLLAFQAAFGGLYNSADQPISFFYVHFICLLSALYLPLFAISSAFAAGVGQDVLWTADVVNGLIVLLQSIFVVGLRQLGQNMSDPFGSDLEDLSVMHYVDSTWRWSNRIMEAREPTQPGGKTEEDIVRERVSIGTAWEHGVKKSKKARASSSGVVSEEEEDAGVEASYHILT